MIELIMMLLPLVVFSVVWHLIQGRLRKGSPEQHGLLDTSRPRARARTQEVGWQQLCAPGGAVGLLAREADLRGWTHAVDPRRAVITGACAVGTFRAEVYFQRNLKTLAGGALVASLQLTLTLSEEAAARWQALKLCLPLLPDDTLAIYRHLKQLPAPGHLTLDSGEQVTLGMGGVEHVLRACFGDSVAAQLQRAARDLRFTLCYLIVTPAEVTLHWCWVRQDAEARPDHQGFASLVLGSLRLIEAMDEAPRAPVERALGLVDLRASELELRASELELCAQLLDKVWRAYEDAAPRFTARFDEPSRVQWQDVVLWYHAQPDAALAWVRGPGEALQAPLAHKLDRVRSATMRDTLAALLVEVMGAEALRRPKLSYEAGLALLQAAADPQQLLVDAFAPGEPTVTLWELLDAATRDESLALSVSGWWGMLSDEAQARTIDDAHALLARELLDLHADDRLVRGALIPFTASATPHASARLHALAHTMHKKTSAAPAVKAALARMPEPQALAAGGLTLAEGVATDGALTLTADAGALSAADAGEQG